VANCEGVGLNFTHLNTVSYYSFRYGVVSPEALALKAAELEMPGIALTDRDGLSGAVEFFQACSRYGIKAHIGAHLEIAHGTRTSHFVALARNADGFIALNRLVTAHHEVGITFDALEVIANLTNAQQGLVILLGPDSELANCVLHAHFHSAQTILLQWQKSGFDIRPEIISHRTEYARNHKSSFYSTHFARQYFNWSLDHSLEPILTNAVRYLTKNQARTADLLDATRNLTTLSTHSVLQHNQEAYFHTADGMYSLAEEICGTKSRAEKLVGQTVLLADSLEVTSETLGIGKVFLPELSSITNSQHETKSTLWNLPVVQPYSDQMRQNETVKANQLLRDRCLSAYRSYPQTEESKSRLEAELAVIFQLDFSRYFLTVATIVDDIKSKGIRVAARGSGAGSFVNYLLGISVLDPLEYGLLMERFLSPLRNSLPDIDIDVESHRRLEIYDDISQRFGSQRVAAVAMFDTYRVRQAIRDVGRALGLPAGEIGVFAKAFPRIRAKSVRGALEEFAELRSSTVHKLAQTGYLNRMLDLVESLDGLPRHIALHPCGVLVSDARFVNRIALQTSNQGFPLSQYGKDDVETLGLLKLDVLGIRMQSAMAYAVSEIKRTESKDIVLDAIDFKDSSTFHLIQSTKTLGCFQIESPGQRELIGKFSPGTFNDIIIDISLFRPGPVKSDMITPFLEGRHGWKEVEYLHPQLQEILSETSGVVVFHEQVIKVLSEMTGCSYAEADLKRRQFGQADYLRQLRAWFYSSALKRKFNLDAIDRVWDILVSFASFGFCKAHAAAFAIPTYQSAWLKQHFPAAFYAGILTHDPGMYPKRALVHDARLRGVPILPIDINKSVAEYCVEECSSGWGVRIGLSEIKNISVTEVESIVLNQPFSSLFDFYQRAEVSRTQVETLITLGAFDALHPMVTRRDLLLYLHDIAKEPLDNLFVFEPEIEKSGLSDFTIGEKLQNELEVLGIDLTTHVLNLYSDITSKLPITYSENLLNSRSGQEVVVVGMKVSTQTPPMRSGKRVIFITLDDATGPVDVTFFADSHDEYASTLFTSSLLLVRGVVRRTGPRGVSIRGIACWDLQGISSDNLRKVSRTIHQQSALSAG
jgi:error-prone DNA polymerase